MGVKLPKVAGYELVQQIGGGGFSTVWRAVNIDEHRVAACKVIAFTDKTTDADRKTVEKEMRVHGALKHENVLEFLNAAVVDMKYQARYMPGIYMLLELAAGGDLFDKIAPDEGVGEEVAHYYFTQLVAGMTYIHGQGVCHRDLKPENLLLDITGRLKISDFGLSSVFRLKESGKTRLLTERCGSLPYVAPELNGDKAYAAEPIDVWGIGVILFTLLAGNTPWDEPTQNSPEFMRFLSGEILTEPPWHKLGGALDLVLCLLAVDPCERITLSDVYQHPWFTQSSQFVSKSFNSTDLADALTENLRRSGDLSFATGLEDTPMDTDQDQMMSATHNSQFTQCLMLFSQTQNGTRYTPHLTRFYSSFSPDTLLCAVGNFFLSQNVSCKQGSDLDEKLRLRIGGFDARNERFKGWVEFENFSYQGKSGCFCVMQRDVGSAISWRQLWKAVVLSSEVGPSVLRK